MLKLPTAMTMLPNREEVANGSWWALPGAATSRFTRDRTLTTIPDVDSICAQIPSKRHLELYSGILKTWKELQGVLNSYQNLDEKLEFRLYKASDEQVTTLNLISQVYGLFVDNEDLGQLSYEDAVWLGQRTAKQLVEAANIIQIAGPSVEYHDLRRHFKWEPEFIDELERTNQIISFEAFDWRWFPNWQFDQENKDRYLIVADLLEMASNLVNHDDETILYWAIRKSDILSGSTPAHWLYQGKDKTILLESFRKFSMTVAERANPSEYSYLPMENLETMSTFQEKQESEPSVIDNNSLLKIRDDILKLEKDSNAYRHLISYLNSFNQFTDLSELELEYQSTLDYIGTEVARNYIYGYPVYVYLFLYLSANMDSLSNIQELSCCWLGKITADKVSTMAGLISVVGPKFTLQEVTKLLNLDSQQISILESNNELISFFTDDFHWFPRWQFDIDHKKVNQTSSEVIGILKAPNSGLGNFEIASWMTTRNSDGLAYHTPAEWLEAPDKDPKALINAVNILVEAINA